MTFKPITVESLEALAKPFIDAGVKTLYFAAVENRVYCGKVVPNAIRGGTGAPHSVVFLVGQNKLEDVVTVLENNR